MVAGGKASSGSIAGVAGCLLLLLAGESRERQTVVAEGGVRPLAVEASGNIIPKITGYVLLLSAGKASGKLLWRVVR